MLSEDSHLSREELLLSIDGELAPGDAGRVEAHLAACWSCRVRRQEMETAIAEFVRLEQGNFFFDIPSADGPRALLKARLAQAAETQRGPWHGWFGRVSWPIGWAAAAILVIGAIAIRSWSARRPAALMAVTIPNPNLTPGATVLLSQREVCSETSAKNKAVPASIRRQVFDEYGIAYAEPRAYEVDYLITPALGGADDIRNLWPQSSSATVWNAQVKDALEDYLRGLVCDGRLDLATAQRDIAGNWIEAYKKYFHTDRPLTLYR